jgi:hypothetical protein
MNKFSIIICFLALVSACQMEKVDSDISLRNVELFEYIRDSTSIFIKTNELDVSGYFEGDTLRVKYFSVSPDEYFTAFKESEDYISLFLRESRFNERLGEGVYRKNDSDLIIDIDGKSFIFNDNKSERSWFYYEGKFGEFHLIRSIQYEDILTYYLNSKTGNIEKLLALGNMATNISERLVFYSEFPTPIYSKDNTEITIFQVNSDRRDTLLFVQSDWFSMFPFFKNPHELYYIHNIYDDQDGLQSSYAKMEISWK